MPEEFPESVVRRVRQLGAGRARLLVAVSGGADSVALLRALARFASPGLLVVAHFDHGLRGAESDGDARFVRDLALSLGLPSVSETWNRDGAAGAVSEEAAREARYAFLRRLARQLEAPFVATGHTADDQAETVLHHLLRGTGLRGLRGIPASRPLDGPGDVPEDEAGESEKRGESGSPIRLIRPLLHVTRGAIEAWLTELGQEWRDDRSNATADFTRNRIRRELLPHLRREFSPRLDSLLGRLAEQADETLDYLRSEAQGLLSQMILDRQPQEVRLDASHVERRPPLLVREALVELWTEQGWPRQAMTHTHWVRAEEVIRGLTPAVDLPDGLRIERRRSLVVIQASRP